MKDFLLVIDHTGNPNSAVASTTEQLDSEEEAKQRITDLAKKGTPAFVYGKIYGAEVTVEVKEYKRGEGFVVESTVKPEGDETAATLIP